MPIPSAISDLSTTPSLNSPAGSESPALVDDYLRTHAAFIKQVSDSKANDADVVKLTGNQTIDGTKTFSSPIAIGSGGTGQTTAAAAFNALKQDATDAVTGVVELATTAEAQAGTDTTRAITPARLRDGLNASGSAPIYACRAWVNFNGTGTVAIRASGNVTSITDNGVGDYTVNFTTAMPDANYSMIGTAAFSAANFFAVLTEYTTGGASPRTASSVRVRTHEITAGPNFNVFDTTQANVAIFR